VQKYSVQVVLLEDMLGTVPLDKDVYTKFSVEELPELPGDELESLVRAIDNNLANDEDTAEEGSVFGGAQKPITGFHKDEHGNPIIYNYVIKGFLKAACGALRRTRETLSNKLSAYKQVIDGLFFVNPRRISIELSGPIGILERPLRAQTAQGERVAIARSETVPAGSTLAFEIIALGDVIQKGKGTMSAEELIREWMDYGKWRGLGQWRNAGYGAFEAVISREPAEAE